MGGPGGAVGEIQESPAEGWDWVGEKPCHPSQAVQGTSYGSAGGGHPAWPLSSGTCQDSTTQPVTASRGVPDHMWGSSRAGLRQSREGSPGSLLGMGMLSKFPFAGALRCVEACPLCAVELEDEVG